MEFNERLLKVRKANNLTQSEVAAQIEVAIRTYQNYESGMRTPRTEILEKICKVLGVDTTVLLDDYTCKNYLQSKSNDNYYVQETKLEHKTKLLRKFVPLSASIVPIVIGSISMGPLGLPLMAAGLRAAVGVGAAGLGTLLLDKVREKDCNNKELDNNLKRLYKELSDITILKNNITANAIPLNEVYTELASITQSEEAKIEDYKKFLQLNKAVTLFQEISTLLLNKERLCKKAINILETVPLQLDSYNTCIEEIIHIETEQYPLIEEINKEMIDLRNKGFFDSYEKLV